VIRQSASKREQGPTAEDDHSVMRVHTMGQLYFEHGQVITARGLDPAFTQARGQHITADAVHRRFTRAIHGQDVHVIGQRQRIDVSIPKVTQEAVAKGLKNRM